MKTIRVRWPHVLTVWILVLLASALSAQPSPTAVPPNYVELSRTVVQQGGRTTTFVNVKPPQLRPRTIPASPRLPPVLTQDEIALAERRAGKTEEAVVLVADVYLGARPLTVLRWSEDGIAHRAVSNLDFRLLSPVMEFETDTAIYLWFPILCTAGEELLDPMVRAQARQLPEGVCDYALLESAALVSPRLLALLDHAHAYAQFHREKLHRDLVQREAAQRAADARPRPPPSPKTVYYWLEQGARR